jgi:hypothetical protein
MLSRIGGKLPRRLEKEKLSKEEALAIQIELEDEQLHEWRKMMVELKKKEDAKLAAKSKTSEKGKPTAKAKDKVKSKTAAKPKATEQTKSSKPKATVKTQNTVKAKVEPGKS